MPSRGKWTRIAKLTLLGVIVAVVGVLVAVGVSRSGGGEPTPPTSPTTPTTGPTKTSPAPPPKPAYLEALTPSEGDKPQLGDVQLIRGRDFPHSIFYEKIGEASKSKACEEADNCRATFYQLSSGYRLFTASFGVFAHGTSAAGQLASGHWRVAVNGKVIKQGDVVANTTPEPVSIPLNGGQELELRVTVQEPGIAESNTAVWGNAKVS
jgi:hypothetical protein